ncbi:DUF3073 domain-containing protein [Schaalia cardiffensis]|uniref:DUF3073 domain-containing protein n=1 Tax=Schaalia cardiffensis TaxID=181487 RepID=UPI0018E78E4E|nr:DUF3073 domain-containing protein [Schaalia cardiffensis]MBJ2329646.1 DUF3073 domain-containing protein [Schaalia cardiffensis]
MGRGRQKAKQTKVARKLKYFSPDTDLDALQRELASSESHSYEEYEDEVENPEEDEDLYSKYADFAQEEPEDDSPELDEEFWISPKK